MRKDIKIGDKVQWMSCSRGTDICRTGTVLALIPAGENAVGHVPKTAKKSHVKYDYDVSKIDRILVAVMAGKNGKITHYYAPYAGKLEVTNE